MPPDGRRASVALELTMDADLPLPPAIGEASLHSLSTFALAAEGASGPWEINVRFTTDAEIQRLHLDFMGLDLPTDIMTFPYDGDPVHPFMPAGSGGDIVISVPTAEAHAADAGWGLDDELLFLVLHGLLHILGWNDEDADERAAMLARQADILGHWRHQAGRGAG